MSRQNTLSSTSTTTTNNMTADILSKYPLIIQATSLYDRIQSSSTTNSSSPSSPSSPLIEHTIDRDVSFIFYLTPHHHHHHHDYSSHFLNDSVTMPHQKDNDDNDDYSNDVHKGTKNEYVSFSKFNPSEVIPSSSSSSSTTTILCDEHQKQQEQQQQQHQDPPNCNNFNDYTNNNSYMMINNINALANIKWLITASRTVLTSLYSIDKSNIYSSITNSHNTIHELQDLNTKLIKHKKDIFLIFQDICKIQLCYNICMNYNSQLRLLINHYKKESDSSRSSSDSSDYHRKVDEDNNSAVANDVVINLQSEYVHYDGVYLHWNPRNSDNIISSTSSSTTTNIDNNARVNSSSNNNDDNYHNNISLDKDLCVYDIDKSLSRLILLQNQLESQLYHHHHHHNTNINNSNYNVNYHDNNQTQLSSNETKSNQSNNHHDDNNNTTNNNNYFSSKLALLVNKTTLFASQQQQQPHHHHYHQHDHYHQLKHQQHSNSSDVVNIDSSIRTPNPLHAVMQSVFSSSSSFT